jgi:hypothetical protein
MRLLRHARVHSMVACWAISLAVCLLGAPRAAAQATGSDAPAASDHPAAKDDNNQSPTAGGTTKLRILVTGNTDKPVANASVYVRYNVSGGLLHHDKLTEMDLKTNQDGSVKVPEIPQGKIMIQVVAPGWHTYGKWYDVDKSEQVISIKLEPPPHWY